MVRRRRRGEERGERREERASFRWRGQMAEEKG